MQYWFAFIEETCMQYVGRNNPEGHVGIPEDKIQPFIDIVNGQELHYIRIGMTSQNTDGFMFTIIEQLNLLS